MVLKSDNMPMNILLARHKCSEELTGPLPDDETSMGAQNLRRMRHLEKEEKDNFFVKEIISTSGYDKEADVKMVSSSDKHSIQVYIYQIYVLHIILTNLFRFIEFFWLQSVE